MADTIPPPPSGYQVQDAASTTPALDPNLPPPPPGYQAQPIPANAPSLTSGSGTPMGHALQQGLIVKDDYTKLPKAFATMAANLPTDPQAKTAYLAKSLFPDLSASDAMARFGTQGGRAFYIDNDGQAYYAEPKFAPLSDWKTTLKDLPDTLAKNVGPSLPAAGGLLGGAATEALGGVPGAAAGGAAGDVVRQAAAKYFTGEDLPTSARLLQTGGAALEQGVGQAAGNLLNIGVKGAIKRNPLKVAGYDVPEVTPQLYSQAQNITDTARGLGVSLTPAEATNLPSLIVRQRQLGRQPASMNIMGNFNDYRNNVQLPAAWDRVLMGISPQQAGAVGARSLGEGANATIQAAKDARSAVADPLYKQTVTPTNVMSAHDYNNLVGSNPAFAQAIQSVRSDPLLSSLVANAPDQSLAVLDLAKRNLDGIAKAESGPTGNPTRAMVASNAAADLRTQLDQIFPDYAKARGAYESMSPAVTELKQGTVGLAAKDKANNFQQVPNLVFGNPSADPMTIATARNAYEKAGQMDAWNAGLRSYLDNVYAGASKQAQGPASTVWKTLMADPRQRANLQAAMTPHQWNGFQDFMNVLEAVKRSPAEGSPTATDLNADFRGPIAKGASAVLRGAEFWQIPDQLASTIDKVAGGQGAKSMANLVTSPDALQSLQRLKMLKPGTQTFNKELGYLTTLVGLKAATGNSPQNSLPGYMQSLPPNLQPTVQ